VAERAAGKAGGEMGEIRRFSIQRSDGVWYAGQQADGMDRWESEAQVAHVFERYQEAMTALNRLRSEGHAVQLFGRE